MKPPRPIHLQLGETRPPSWIEGAAAHRMGGNYRIVEWRRCYQLGRPPYLQPSTRWKPVWRYTP